LEGLYPAESDGFLRAIQIRSTTSFGGEVKPFSTNVVRFYGMLKIPTGMIDTDRQNSEVISRPVLPALLLGVSVATRAENCGG
jgi:hypothetical protein